MKKLLSSIMTLAVLLGSTSSALAHVVVKPGDVATGSFQTFTVSVPNEKDAATTQIKLMIPDNLQFVTPSLKQGWTITTEKEGQGETAKTKSITWSGGSIPAGFRDDFTFSAKAPDTDTELQWKAYQTYENGVTVSWDKAESEQPKKADGSPDYSTSGPFSVTKVSAQTDEPAATQATNGQDSIGRSLGAAALLVSLVALAVTTRKKA